MEFNSLFDVSYVLTLVNRVMSYDRLHKECRTKGFVPKMFLVGKNDDPEVAFDHDDVDELPPRFSNSINYPTWHSRPNAYNAWLSHRKILEKTLAEGKHSLLLLEDDATFEPDFDEIFRAIVPTLSKLKWDMLYLGGYHRPGSWTPTENKNLIRLNGSGGWHGVIMKENVIRELLEFSPIGPMDWIAQNYVHPIFSCYAVYPSIISQIDGYSHVEGHELSKPSRYAR